MFLRGRTGFPIVLYVVFLGLSFGGVSKVLRPFVDRSHVSVWRWVERLPGFRRVFRAGCRVSLFLVDETAVIVKGLMAWVWVAYEPLSNRMLGFWLSWNRNSIQAGLFLESLVMAFGRHPVWTDGAPWYHRCRFGDWLWRGLYRHSRIGRKASTTTTHAGGRTVP